jgi:hypothetical protein
LLRVRRSGNENEENQNSSVFHINVKNLRRRKNRKNLRE